MSLLLVGVWLAFDLTLDVVLFSFTITFYELGVRSICTTPWIPVGDKLWTSRNI